MGARFFSQPEKGRSALRKDARPLEPAELIRLRKMLRKAERAQEVDEYLDSAEVAARLGLHKRTVLDLAHAGEFDVDDECKAFKPAPNRLRIPKRGVQQYTGKRAVFLSGAGVGTREEQG